MLCSSVGRARLLARYSFRAVGLGLRVAALLLCCLTAPWARADVHTLIQALDAERIRQGIAGLSLTLVERDRVLWAGGLGVKDLRSNEPVTHETLFRIGSVTKLFTAMALLQMQEQGRLQLTDRLRQHVPDARYRNDWEASHPLTIAMLLEHTAGLHDLTREEFDHNDPRPLTLDEGMALRPDARVARWQPGLHASYSNAGYGFAGQVIERVSGRAYEAEIQARLFDPLAMASSGFFLTDAVRARLATGYAPNGRDTLPYWHMTLRPFGGIHTSARDMVPFLRMLLNDGRHGERVILTPASLRRAEVPATTLAARAGLSFGYGLGLNAYHRNGVRMHGHSGDADGYLSFIGYSRAVGRAYFISINRFQWSALRAVRGVLEDWITQGHGVAPPPAVALDEGTLRTYAGRYRPATRRFEGAAESDDHAGTLTVVLEQGRLYTETAAGIRRALIPVDTQRFRREHEPEATSAFVRDDDGRLYFQEDDAYQRLEQ